MSQRNAQPAATPKNKMAETSKLKKPRRKKGAKFHPKDAPFPVPIESITNKECADSRWFYYTGYFRDNCVVIENHGDLTFLYKMGFFGKGNLSRSKPEYEIISNISQKAFSKSEKLRRLPPKERQIRQSKFRDIRKERLKNHKEWYKLSNEITSATPVKTSRELVNNEKKDELAGTSYSDTLIAGDDDFEDLPEKKRRKEEFEDSDSDLNEGETNHKEPDIEEEKEDKEEVLGDSNMDTENKKGNRDVEEVMQDVLRHGKEELTNNDVTFSSQDSQLKQKTTANKKDDPYKVFEHLQLSLEEAFFLSYGLGCLTVYDNEKRPLTISEMWTRFRRAKKDFIPCYIVYHYLRSKGWVPKSGIKYGTDFVLYKQGMPFYHSSYSIIVQVADEDSLAPSCSYTALLGHREPLSWLSIGGPNRVSEHAAKEVMICYVIVPSGITDQELSLSSCIPRFKVQEVIMRRWIPERSRDSSTGKQK